MSQREPRLLPVRRGQGAIRPWLLPVAVAVVVAAALLGLWPMPAAAHTTEQPYLYVFVEPERIDGRVELAIGDVATVLGVDLSGSDQQIEETLRANRDQLVAYLADHLQLGGDGDPLTLSFGDVDLFREAPGSLAFAVVQFDADSAPLEPPATLDVTFDPFFTEVPGRDGLLLHRGGYEAGEFVADKEVLVTFTDDSRTQSVDLGARGAGANIGSSITLGIDHIKTGPDHILFVLALLLPSVLVYRRGWHPIAGFGGALWRVLKIATFFTLAHSITFTMAGMGWLPTPPAKVVESIIALSIAATALHNIRPIAPNREWSLSFIFGLFHGMGFASLVSELDVSRTSQLLSLLGRNIGIEIGQVAVICLLFPALFMLRRTPIYPALLTTFSLALTALALLWTVERIWEIDLGTDGLVDQAVSVPTAYWISGGLTALAAVALVVFTRRDELSATMPLKG